MAQNGMIAVTKIGLISALSTATLICALSISYGLWESARYERHSYIQSMDYAAYTRRKIAKSCIGIPLKEAIKCRYAALDAERDYKNNQLDLAAQRQSALWAYIMGVAAIIGVALSALGVWLIKATFDETQKAADASKVQAEIASKALTVQTRPYIAFRAASVKQAQNLISEDGPKGEGGIFRIVWKNVGNGIAAKVHMGVFAKSHVLGTPLPHDIAKFGDPEDIPMVMAPQSVNESDPIMLSKGDWQKFKRCEIGIIINGIVIYQGIGSPDFYESEVCLLVTASGVDVDKMGREFPLTNAMTILEHRNRMS